MDARRGLWTASLLACFSVFGGACSLGGPKEPNQELAGYVDLQRFMGDWYVHGAAPTALDKDAYDAIETYEMREDGKIATTYTFRKGGHDGKLKSLRPLASVRNAETNAEWSMRFFGIVSSPYYILHVSEDYDETVIGHPGRKFAWIMTRSPEVSDAGYERLLSELARRDYDLGRIERIPHRQR